MPVTKKFNRPGTFGPDNIFCITDWKGFVGAAAQEYATVTGTLNEVETPYGTGIQVGVANSYIDFNWTGLSPLLTQARSIFTRFYLPSIAATYGLVGWGAAPAENATFVYNNTGGQYGGGLGSDADAGGVLSAGWFTIGMSNTGLNAGANIVYGQGTQQAAGTNGGNAITTYTSLRILNFSHAAFACPVGSIAKEVLVFRRILSAGEFLDLHNACIGNKL